MKKTIILVLMFILSISFVFADQLPQPTNQRIISTTNDSIYFSWERVPYAEWYPIYQNNINTVNVSADETVCDGNDYCTKVLSNDSRTILNYIFNDTTIIDYSGQGNNGIISEAVYNSTSKIYNFPINSSYMRVTSPLYYMNNSENFSVSVWVYDTDEEYCKSGLCGGIVGNMFSNLRNGWLLGKGNATAGYRYSFYFANSTTYTAPYVSGAFNNQWIFLAGKYNGTHACIYFNGGNETCSAAMQKINTTINYIEVGKVFGSSVYNFNGSIAALRIYNYSLTESEVLAEYNKKAFNKTNYNDTTTTSINSDYYFNMTAVNNSYSTRESDNNLGFLWHKNCLYAYRTARYNGTVNLCYGTYYGESTVTDDGMIGINKSVGTNTIFSGNKSIVLNNIFPTNDSTTGFILGNGIYQRDIKISNLIMKEFDRNYHFAFIYNLVLENLSGYNAHDHNFQFDAYDNITIMGLYSENSTNSGLYVSGTVYNKSKNFRLEKSIFNKTDGNNCVHTNLKGDEIYEAGTGHVYINNTYENCVYAHDISGTTGAKIMNSTFHNVTSVFVRVWWNNWAPHCTLNIYNCTAKDTQIFGNYFEHSDVYLYEIYNSTKNTSIYNNTYAYPGVIHIFNTGDFIDFNVYENTPVDIRLKYSGLSSNANGRVDFNYSGLKKFNVSNSTVNIDLSTYPSNRITDVTNNIVLANNVNEYSLNVSGNTEYLVNLTDALPQPKNQINISNTINSILFKWDGVNYTEKYLIYQDGINTHNQSANTSICDGEDYCEKILYNSSSLMLHLITDTSTPIDYSGRTSTITTQSITFNSTSKIYTASSNSSSYVRVSSQDVLMNNTGDYFTVSAWINSIDDAYCKFSWCGNIVGTGATNSVNFWSLRIMNSTSDIKYLDFTIANSTSSFSTYDNTYSISINKWYHVAGRYNGTGICTYINGVQVDCTAVSIEKLNTTVNYVELFNAPGSTVYGFNGSIAGVKIWNRSLTIGEIQREYDEKPFNKTTKNVTNLRMNITNHFYINVTAFNSSYATPESDNTLGFSAYTQSNISKILIIDSFEYLYPSINYTVTSAGWNEFHWISNQSLANDGVSFNLTPYYARQGEYALRTSSFCNDAEVSSGIRSEIVQWKTQQNRTRWYGFSTYIPKDDFPFDGNETYWLIVGQWHSTDDTCDTGGSSPALDLSIYNNIWHINARNTTYKCTTGNNVKNFTTNQYTLGEVATDTYTDWVFKVTWNYLDEGELVVWQNGVVVVNSTNPIGYNDDWGAYFKSGIYRSDGSGCPKTVYLDNYKFGNELVNYTEMSTPYLSVYSPINESFMKNVNVNYSSINDSTNTTVSKTNISLYNKNTHSLTANLSSNWTSYKNFTFVSTSYLDSHYYLKMMSCDINSNCYNFYTDTFYMGGCGNGVKNATETCDNTDFGIYSGTCQNYNSGYSSGHLICSADCTTILLTDCTSGGGGGGGTGGGTTPTNATNVTITPNCNNGIVTSKCICGNFILTSGYCIDGKYYTSITNQTQQQLLNYDFDIYFEDEEKTKIIDGVDTTQTTNVNFIIEPKGLAKQQLNITCEGTICGSVVIEHSLLTIENNNVLSSIFINNKELQDGKYYKIIIKATGKEQSRSIELILNTKGIVPSELVKSKFAESIDLFGILIPKIIVVLTVWLILLLLNAAINKTALKITYTIIMSLIVWGIYILTTFIL